MQRAVVLLKCILKGPQRKFGMNMDQTNEVNAVVRKECAHLALEAVRYRGGISKACGHGLYKAIKN